MADIVVIVVGLVVGAIACAIAVRLDPGPGPRRLASDEAWRDHEVRVARMRRWLPLGAAAAIALVSFGAALGGHALRLLIGMAAGFVLTLAAYAVGRWRRTREL